MKTSLNLHFNAYSPEEQQRIVAAYTAYLAEHKRINWSALARILGRDRSALRDFMAAYVEANGEQLPKSPASPSGNDEKVEFTTEGNEATAEWRTEDVKTLDELLAVCKVDLKAWKVDKYVCNKWAVGTKNDDGTVTKTPLFQIKAWLVRAVVEPTEFAPIAPIEIRLPAAKAPALIRKRGTTIKRAVIWPDMQVGLKRDLRTGKLTPLHDRRAIDVALQLTRHIQPDRVVWLGDNADLPDWSTKFLVSPDFVQTTQVTLIELGWICAQVRRIHPAMPIDWIQGNHEKRIEVAIMTNMRQAYGLRPVDDLEGPPALSLERLLNLQQLNINFVGPYPQGEVWLNDNFYLEHGHVVRGQSGKTVAKIVEDARASSGCGHLHRLEMATKTVWSKSGPKTYQAWSFGSLCSIQPGIVPSDKPKQNWQNAIGYAEYEEGDGFYNITPIQIFTPAASAIYDGIRFEARSESDIVRQIEQDTKYDVTGGRR